MRVFRVVLDESHLVKEKKTKFAISVKALQTNRRWCLSGTPIQNGLKDLFSQIEFLKIFPVADRRWWQLNITDSCKTLNFEPLRKVISAICMRRLKTTKDLNDKPILHLPDKQVKVRVLTMSEYEIECYTKIKKFGQVVLKNLAEEMSSQQMSSILTIILRLRQCCCSPYLLTSILKGIDEALKTQVKGGSTRDLMRALQDSADGHIRGYLDNPTSIDTQWRTMFEYEEVQNNSIVAPPIPVPGLRVEEDLESIDLEAAPEIRTDDESLNKLLQESSKLRDLMQIVLKLQQKVPRPKTVIFSHFVSLLALISKLLTKFNIPHLFLHGGCKSEDRTKMLNDFQNTPRHTVFLISVKAGGVGLNLTAASRAILTDPWWNAAVEEQAIDRLYRVGQVRNVKVTRLIFKDTIEEKLLELQRRKKLLSENAFGNQQASQKMTMEEMSRLIME